MAKQLERFQHKTKKTKSPKMGPRDKSVKLYKGQGK